MRFLFRDCDSSWRRPGYDLVPGRIALLLQELRAIEAAREALQRAQSRIDRILNEPTLLRELGEANNQQQADIAPSEQRQQLRTLRQIWAGFLAAGGVTTADYARWRHGETLERVPRNAPAKRHLRLVASRKSIARVRLRDDDHDDAA